MERGEQAMIHPGSVKRTGLGDEEAEWRGVDCTMWIVGSSQRARPKMRSVFRPRYNDRRGFFYVSTNRVLEIYADEGLTTSSQM